MSEQITGTCKQEGCPAGEGGRCLEGLDNVLECPHFEAHDIVEEEPQKQIDEEEPSDASLAEEEFVKLHEGKALDPDSAKCITFAAPTNLIIIAGSADSGKTTLLAGIYERFNRIQKHALYIYAYRHGRCRYLYHC